MRRVNGFGAYLRHTHTVAGARHRQLGIHRVSFAFGVFFIEQWRGNGVGQAIYGAWKRIVFNLQVEGCSIRRSAGVMATAMSFKVFGKAIRLRIFF